jgi:hypothetical protein
MDFEGFALLIAFACSIVSFWPSARGHWLGPNLGGAVGDYWCRDWCGRIRAGGRVLLPAIFVICPAYLLFGVSSILLWKWRRPLKRRS